MSRIHHCTDALKSAGHHGLITFTMAGDPDYAQSLESLHRLAESGVDIIELGMPFSDPMADGPVIQAAGLRALAAGQTMQKTLQMVAEFRRDNDTTPIVLMGYYNPIYHYGAETFCRDARQAGVDGLIIVDLPPEEEGEFTPYLNGLDLIRLIAPTTDDDRIKTLVKSASGFVYTIAVTGITGDKSATATDIESMINRIRAHTDLPVALGFGIRTAQQVQEAGQFADLVVVGSALINEMEAARAKGESPADAASRMIQTLKQEAA